MIKQLIEAFPLTERSALGHSTLRISEFYYDTIQGEGISVGCPAVFLRLQGCILNCSFCDTQAVWKEGNPYTYDELLTMMEEVHVIKKLQEEYHLVITGGSPLMQQEHLLAFISRMMRKYYFRPYIEIENECVILPHSLMIYYVSQWNNSPKLTNSGVRKEARYKPKVISAMASLENSWFKFVISSKEDWKEIENEFLQPELISKHQVILMPMGETPEEVVKHRELTVNLAIDNGVRYCSREHIMIWGKKTGI